MNKKNARKKEKHRNQTNTPSTNESTTSTRANAGIISYKPQFNLLLNRIITDSADLEPDSTATPCPKLIADCKFMFLDGWHIFRGIILEYIEVCDLVVSNSDKYTNLVKTINILHYIRYNIFPFFFNYLRVNTNILPVIFENLLCERLRKILIYLIKDNQASSQQNKNACLIKKYHHLLQRLDTENKHLVILTKTMHNPGANRKEIFLHFINFIEFKNCLATYYSNTDKHTALTAIYEAKMLLTFLQHTECDNPAIVDLEVCTAHLFKEIKLTNYPAERFMPFIYHDLVELFKLSKQSITETQSDSPSELSINESNYTVSIVKKLKAYIKEVTLAISHTRCLDDIHVFLKKSLHLLTGDIKSKHTIHWILVLPLLKDLFEISVLYFEKIDSYNFYCSMLSMLLENISQHITQVENSLIPEPTYLNSNLTENRITLQNYHQFSKTPVDKKNKIYAAVEDYISTLNMNTSDGDSISEKIEYDYFSTKDFKNEGNDLHGRHSNQINAIFFLMNFLKNSDEQELQENLVIILLHKSIELFDMTYQLCIMGWVPFGHYQQYFNKLISYIYIISTIETECNNILNRIFSNPSNAHLDNIYTSLQKRYKDLLNCYETLNCSFLIFHKTYNNFIADFTPPTHRTNVIKLLTNFIPQGDAIDINTESDYPLDDNISNMSGLLKLAFKFEYALSLDIIHQEVPLSSTAKHNTIDIALYEKFDSQLLVIIKLCGQDPQIFWMKINIPLNITLDMLIESITKTNQTNAFHFLKRFGGLIESLLWFIQKFEISTPVEIFLINQIKEKLHFINCLLRNKLHQYSISPTCMNSNIMVPVSDSSIETIVLTNTRKKRPNRIRELAKTQKSSVSSPSQQPEKKIDNTPSLSLALKNKEKVSDNDIPPLYYGQEQDDGERKRLKLHNHERRLKRKKSPRDEQNIISRREQKRALKNALKLEKEKANEEKRIRQQERRIERKKMRTYVDKFKPNSYSSLTAVESDLFPEMGEESEILGETTISTSNTMDCDAPLVACMEALSITDNASTIPTPASLPVNVNNDRTNPSSVPSEEIESRFYLNERMQYPSFVIAIFEAVESKGFKIYLRGGAPRDFICKKQPNDYDFVTNCPGDQLQALLPGIKQCPYEGKKNLHQIGTYVDIVCHTTLSSDDLKKIALSADISLNKLFSDSHGRIIDFFKVYDDVKLDFIKTCEFEVRVKDDPNLILRLIRHSNHLQKSLQPSDIVLMQKYISNIFAQCDFSIFLKSINDLFSRKIGRSNFILLHNFGLLPDLGLASTRTLNNPFFSFCTYTLLAYDNREQDDPHKYDPAYTMIALLLLGKIVDPAIGIEKKSISILATECVNIFISHFPDGFKEKERSFRIVIPKKIISHYENFKKILQKDKSNNQNSTFTPAYDQMQSASNTEYYQIRESRQLNTQPRQF